MFITITAIIIIIIILILICTLTLSLIFFFPRYSCPAAHHHHHEDMNPTSMLDVVNNNGSPNINQRPRRTIVEEEEENAEEILRVQILTILIMSIDCPFSDVRDAFREFLKKLRVSSSFLIPFNYPFTVYKFIFGGLLASYTILSSFCRQPYK